MTAVRRPAADAWQTAAVFAGGVCLGRWGAADAFGYTLLATTFGPIGVAVAVRAVRHRLAATAVAIVLISLPFWLDERPATAGRLTLLVSVWTAAVVVSSDAVRVVWASIGWLTWVIGPLVRPDAWGGAWVLTLNPVLAANAANDRAGDWTHQAVAYRWLTSLGQDVPFEWPASAWATGVVVYGTFAVAVAVGVGAGRRLFHVEQLSARSNGVD